ncbi:MAG: glycosyltransferase, partial [Aridibacter sp.]
LPSYFEGLPVSMLEALAAKCVVIATNVGSIGTVIEDGMNGFLVEPHDVEQIVGKIKPLLLNKTDRKSLQNNARKTIEERFSINEHLSKLKEIYETVRM